MKYTTVLPKSIKMQQLHTSRRYNVVATDTCSSVPHLETQQQAEAGEVTTIAQHGLQTGDTVLISEVEGMTELNGTTHEVAGVKDMLTFSSFRG